jgi:hypothetical protein
MHKIKQSVSVSDILRIVINSDFTTFSEFPGPPQPTSYPSPFPWLHFRNHCPKGNLHFHTLIVTEKKALCDGLRIILCENACVAHMKISHFFSFPLLGTD